MTTQPKSTFEIQWELFSRAYLPPPEKADQAVTGDLISFHRALLVLLNIPVSERATYNQWPPQIVAYLETRLSKQVVHLDASISDSGVYVAGRQISFEILKQHFGGEMMRAIEAYVNYLKAPKAPLYHTLESVLGYAIIKDASDATSGNDIKCLCPTGVITSKNIYKWEEIIYRSTRSAGNFVNGFQWYLEGHDDTEETLMGNSEEFKAGYAAAKSDKYAAVRLRSPPKQKPVK